MPVLRTYSQINETVVVASRTVSTTLLKIVEDSDEAPTADDFLVRLVPVVVAAVPDLTASFRVRPARPEEEILCVCLLPLLHVRSLTHNELLNVSRLHNEVGLTKLIGQYVAINRRL